MNDEQRLRYSRHLLLPELGEQGQEMLLDSHAVIVGLGGLGSPAALYLAAAGVGRLTLVDDDHVELGNLQRQIVHSTARIGQSKVASARQQLLAINPEIEIVALAQRLDEAALQALLHDADVALDCTDNYPSRFALNRCCQAAAVPLVSAAAVRMQGQISVFMPRGPCYRCLYADESAAADSCAERGVFSPLLGVLGSLQAAEALKLLSDVGQSLAGRVLRFDAQRAEWRSVRLQRDAACPVCGDSGDQHQPDSDSPQ